MGLEDKGEQEHPALDNKGEAAALREQVRGFETAQSHLADKIITITDELRTTKAALANAMARLHQSEAKTVHSLSDEVVDRLRIERAALLELVGEREEVSTM